MAKPKKANSNGVEEVVSSEKVLETAILSLQKQFGPEIVSWLDKVEDGPLEVVPTGSLSLDAALGVGGFVRGRIYELYGPPSCGKTTLALSTIVEVQKRGGTAVFIDAEHSLSTALMKKMGIDISKVIVVRGHTGEENLDAAKTLLSTANVGICVIDSISALQPTAEANLASFGDQTMGLHPRLMARMCRDLTPKVARTKTILLLINQIRANLGGYGKTETTAGGNALQHHYSGRIRVSGAGAKSSQIVNADGAVIGHRAGFEITKNKLSAPFRKAEVDLLYGIGFDRYGEIVDLSVDMGFIDLNGSWYSHNGDRLTQGRAKMVDYLRSHPELTDALEIKIRELLGMMSTNELSV